MADELARLQAEITSLNSEAADRAISLVIKLGTLYVQQAREIEGLRAERNRLDYEIGALTGTQAIMIDKITDAQHGATHEAEEVDRLRDENERIKANYVTRAEEIRRRHDAITPLVEERDRLRTVVEAAQAYAKVVRKTHGINVPWEALDAFLAALDGAGGPGGEKVKL